jgi:hypothetical protein
MRPSPSIAPEAAALVDLVTDDLAAARPGERRTKDTDRETLIRDLLEGQHSNPAWIVARNADEGFRTRERPECLESFPQAKALQRPLRDDAIIIVARRENEVDTTSAS